MRSSEAALDASIPLVRQLRGLVSQEELRGLAADLRPTIPALARLTRESIPLTEQNRALASCQNEVVLQWAHDKIEDKQFPAQGPVYTEAPKAFPGLAGESRAGDANGQWFRVLAAGGTNLVQLAPGVFGSTTNPILGANPPKPKARPPLDESQPCENQEPPDLRSQPGDPPKQWTGRHEHAGVQGPLRAGQGPRRRLAQGPDQARGAHGQAQGRSTRTRRRA